MRVTIGNTHRERFAQRRGGEPAASHPPQCASIGMTAATKNRVYLGIIVALLLVIVGLAYKFIVAGSTRGHDDGRVAIVLEPAERALMLREMREFVVAIERVTDALARDDLPAVAMAARAAGSARAHDVPVAMLGKLPLEFKTLAFATHRGFDAMAARAEAGATPKETLVALSTLLQQCVTCHARYALATTAVPSGR
ncbi:MAG: hypothetical protein IT522_13810 [Burkholderiales bacterium]|nr:hypothetical protein [Burkholderiales bacterium]